LKKNNGLAIDNSFTLKFENTTNSVRTITLFEQGGNDPTDAIEVNSAVENASQGNITLPALIWNFVGNQPYQYNANVTPVIAPINIDLFKATDTGTLEIISNNGGSKVDVAILNTDTLNQVNDKINATIRLNADLTNFLSPSGKYAEVNVFFDINYFEQFTLPQPKTNPPYRQSFGVSVQYPTDLPHKLLELNFPTNPASEFGTLNTLNEVATSSANGVVVQDAGVNVTYEEIERSQSGAVYDIRSMGLDVGKAPTQDERDGQMLSPFCFTKFDVNGNELTYCKVPTKDPYQFQDSYGVIDMGTESDNFVLDGRTKFSYDVQPLTSVFITYNYAQLTNLLFDTELGLEQAKKEQEFLTKYDKNKNINRVLKLTAPEFKQTKPK